MLDKKKYKLLLFQFFESESFKDREFLNLISPLSDYSVISLGREEAYSLYLLRRNLIERTVVQNKQFDTVLECLKKYKKDKILIHLLYTTDYGYYFFTGIDVECTLGYIGFPFRKQ